MHILRAGAAEGRRQTNVVEISMKLGKYIGSMAVVVLTASLLAACNSRTTVESNLGIKGAPDWVNKGSQALNDQSGRLIQGIASAPGMNDLSLQTSTADD